MRIFGDPSDATLDADDYVFVGLLPLPFDLAVGADRGFVIAAAEIFVPGAQVGQVFIAGSIIGQLHLAGALAAETFGCR